MAIQMYYYVLPGIRYANFGERCLFTNHHSVRHILINYVFVFMEQEDISVSFSPLIVDLSVIICLSKYFYAQCLSIILLSSFF